MSEDYRDSFGRLCVLEDLVALALKRENEGCIHVPKWANVEKWRGDIDSMRSSIPDNELKEFDDERNKSKHRQGCECLLCTDSRRNP